MEEKITFAPGKKFDIQLNDALLAERKLGEIFTTGIIEKIELKTESWQWEQTGNICVEYRWNGEPSGIAATEATYWVHELRRDGETLVYLMFPIERLKKLCREAHAAGRYRLGVGDGGLSDVILLRLKDILQ